MLCHVTSSDRAKMSRILRSGRIRSSLTWSRSLAASRGARRHEYSVLFASSVQNARTTVFRSSCSTAAGRGGVCVCNCNTSTSRMYSTTVKEPGGNDGKEISDEERSSNLDMVEDLLINVQVEEEMEEEEPEAPKRSTPLSIEECVAILREENAQNVITIELDATMARKYAKYFVTCSGTSTRHLRAMTERLKKEAKGIPLERIKPVVVEGWRCEDWMVVDLGNVVVHLMLEERRQTLELEKLWTLGVEFDDQLHALTQEPEGSSV